MHLQRAGRERLDRDRDLRAALVAVEGDPDLPGARGHHPQARRVEAGIVGGLSGLVRNRRELRTRSRDAQRHHRDRARVTVEHTNLDRRYAGDDGRRADSDEQTVRAGAALPEHVGAADVCGAVGGNRRDERTQRRCADRGFHRCNRWSHVPSASPARALSSANTNAMAILVQNAVSAGAYWN